MANRSGIGLLIFIYVAVAVMAMAILGGLGLSIFYHDFYIFLYGVFAASGLVVLAILALTFFAHPMAILIPGYGWIGASVSILVGIGSGLWTHSWKCFLYSLGFAGVSLAIGTVVNVVRDGI